jgi:hypothetical protein
MNNEQQDALRYALTNLEHLDNKLKDGKMSVLDVNAERTIVLMNYAYMIMQDLDKVSTN